MTYWDRVAEEVRIQGTTFRWVASVLGKSETTISGMRKAGVILRADEDELLTRTMKLPPYYFVTGERFVSRKWPDADQELVDDVNELPAEQQTFIREGAKAQAEKVRSLREGRLGKSSPSA